MGTEDSSEDGIPRAEASMPANPNLKTPLKESLIEVLRELLSLLHPPAKTEHGEYPVLQL